VIEDSRVITGQKPTSAHAVGVALVKQLQAKFKFDLIFSLLSIHHIMAG